MPPSETELRIAVFQWLREKEPYCDGIFDGPFLNRGIEMTPWGLPDSQSADEPSEPATCKDAHKIS